MAKAQRSAERRTKPHDPYRYGWRFGIHGETIPLSEDDILHPHEGDFIVHNDCHLSDVLYLLSIFRSQAKSQPDIHVLGDHRIDFQYGGVEPMGPDVTVLKGRAKEWDGMRDVPCGRYGIANSIRD